MGGKGEQNEVKYVPCVSLSLLSQENKIIIRFLVLRKKGKFLPSQQILFLFPHGTQPKAKGGKTSPEPTKRKRELWNSSSLLSA